MGKETVYFKETREKAITQKDRKDDIKFRREKAQAKFQEKSKNISKRDSDKIGKVKAQKKVEKTADRIKAEQQAKEIQDFTKKGKDFKERKQLLMKEIEERRRQARRTGKSGENIDDAEWEDVEEHEREVFKTTGGFFEVPDSDA